MNQIEQLGKIASDLGCTVHFDEPMKKHTTFQIGGPADLYAVVHNSSALQKVIKTANEFEIPHLVIGNGSNLLVKDEGIRGLVISLDDEFNQIHLHNETTIVCGSSVTLAKLSKFAQTSSLTGLEFVWGIPGTAGGATFMNAGAYGEEMKSVLKSCRHITADGKLSELKQDDLNMTYRHSAYTDNGAIILSLTMQLKKGDSEEIRATMEDLMNRRKTKQPLELPSAGSVFKRPEGHFAGALIEQCKLKGKTIGGAMVSPKHAGFIVNTGNATCLDVLNLIDFIKETVLHETGIELECEVKLIG